MQKHITQLTLLIVSIYSLVIFGLGYFKVRDTLSTLSAFTPNSNGSKVILVVIDAFRIDFALNSNFTFIQQMLELHPDQSRLFLSVADAPTATTQRIEAMMTGNIPSFISVGSSFSAAEVQEDNLIKQMKGANKKIAMLGDDTWVNLFPKYFDVQFPMDSFDATDLNTNDNTVITNIFNVLQNEKPDFLVAHFLGLDHTGHSYNDSNVHLWAKQSQYSVVLNQIYDLMDENTTLIITGDHGMTPAGNHGGDTLQETSTALFTIKKTGIYSELPELSQMNAHQQFVNSPQITRTIHQIDIVPTIALLMDISIPYSNIGVVIPEIINKSNCQKNLKQIWQYLNQMQESYSKYPIDQYENWKQQIQSLNDCTSIVLHLNEIQNSTRKSWNQFDHTELIMGCALCFTILVLQFINNMVATHSQYQSQLRYYIFKQYEFLILFGITLLCQVLVGRHVLTIISVYMQLLLNLNIYIQLRRNYKVVYQQIKQNKQSILCLAILVNFIYLNAQLLLSLNKQLSPHWTIFMIQIETIILIIMTTSNSLCSKQTLWSVITIVIMVVAEQYNTQNKELEQPTMIKLSSNQSIHNFIMKLFVPTLLMAVWISKYIHDKFEKFIYNLMLYLVTLYQFQHSLSLNRNYIIDMIIPKALLLFCLYGVIKTRKALSGLFIILLYSGYSSLVLSCCYIYTVEFLFKVVEVVPTVLNQSNQKLTPFVAAALISNVTNYFWYMFGNRQLFNTISYENAYIGFAEFNIYFTGSLVVLGLFGILFSSHIVIRTILSDRKRAAMYSRIFQITSMYYFLQCTFTTLHCLLNLDSVLVTTRFGPKIIYDSFMYIIMAIPTLADIGPTKHLLN